MFCDSSGPNLVSVRQALKTFVCYASENCEAGKRWLKNGNDLFFYCLRWFELLLFFDLDLKVRMLCASRSTAVSDAGGRAICDAFVAVLRWSGGNLKVLSMVGEEKSIFVLLEAFQHIAFGERL